MSIDMRQFHSVFFEESQEHLDEMEHLLLELNVQQPDTEELNSIFRAAHSIKGGSGIFGFDALASVTHVMENLLDKIRQGKMAITSPLVDLFLTSVDVLKSILKSYRNNTDIDWAGANRLTELLESATAGKAKKTSDKLTKKEMQQGYGFFSDPKPKEDAYGFFADPVVGNSEEAYGFFEDVGQQEQDAYGFFDEAYGEPSVAALPESNDEKFIIADVQPSLSSQAINAANTTIKSKNNEVTSSESSSIRVDVAKVDQLINLVGEIVITQSMMNLLGKSIEGSLGEKYQSIAAELERNTREIQEAVMSIRMLPVSFVFNRFPRVVRDLSQKLGKSIELLIEGGETELDKGLTEKLVDPLTHLVRNSIDHGIESSDVRTARGKNPTGKVLLKANQQGGNIIISIQDDGGGLNRQKILEKAREKNITVSDNPTDAEVWQLIFAPGFSTATQVTDVSGRGVGMDVVKRNVQALGGRIEIESREGEGATFTIRLPLTLAIVDGMGVSVGDQTFIIPLVNIIESMQPAEKDIKSLAGDDQLLLVRDQYWPILPLYKLMQIESHFTQVHKGIAVLVETDKHKFALFVDGLVGQQQVVIKSLEQHYKRVQGVAGATIMGDGSVALILDVESLGLNLSVDRQDSFSKVG